MKRKVAEYEREEEEEQESNRSSPAARIGSNAHRSTVNNHGGDGVKWFRGPEIGKGGFGSVYLANLKEPKSKFSYFPAVMAVKSAEVSVSDTLQKEKEVLSNVQGCVNVIHCYGEEITTGGNNGDGMTYNLLLEHASGGDLCSLIEKFRVSGLPVFDVKRYTKSILLGLKHIHDCGYVHSDLKPGNILLIPTTSTSSSSDSKFVAKIGDLGLAKRAANRTMNGRVYPYFRGTPLYFSPEVVIDNEQEQASDIWALGCIVLEMLTGKPVWDVKDGNSLSHDLLCRIAKVGELPRIPNEIEQDCKDFLKGCFVRNPRYRLTAELLLYHPFVAGLDNDDYKDEEDDQFEVGLDDGSEYSDDQSCSSSDDDNDDCSYFTDEDSLDSSWFVKKLEVVKEMKPISSNTVQQCASTFTITAGAQQVV